MWSDGPRTGVAKEKMLQFSGYGNLHLGLQGTLCADLRSKLGVETRNREAASEER